MERLRAAQVDNHHGDRSIMQGYLKNLLFLPQPTEMQGEAAKVLY
jgi:hypothetical protein